MHIQLVFKYYFFGDVAFKMNANNPAGISPVVSSSFNLIPKTGMWATNSGKAFIDLNYL